MAGRDRKTDIDARTLDRAGASFDPATTSQGWSFTGGWSAGIVRAPSPACILAKTQVEVVDTSPPRPALEIPFALADLGDSQGRLRRASVKSKLALAACTDGITLPMNTSNFCKRRSL